MTMAWQQSSHSWLHCPLNYLLITASEERKAPLTTRLPILPLVLKLGRRRTSIIEAWSPSWKFGGGGWHQKAGRSLLRFPFFHPNGHESLKAGHSVGLLPDKSTTTPWAQSGLIVEQNTQWPLVPLELTCRSFFRGFFIPSHLLVWLKSVSTSCGPQMWASTIPTLEKPPFLSCWWVCGARQGVGGHIYSCCKKEVCLWPSGTNKEYLDLDFEDQQ